MLKIQTIASSSSGNCYVLDNGDSRLMVECGLPWKKVLKELNFDTENFSAILLSHEHGDHSKGIKDAIKAGMDVYCSIGTASCLGSSGHRVHTIKSLEKFMPYRGWIVMPFDVEHDASQPLGFIIQSYTEKLLFLTDTAYCKYRFSRAGITHLMIECNFCDDILERNISSGVVDRHRCKRLKASHMSLQRVKDFIVQQDINTLQEIYLMHLSNENSDEAKFKREVQELTGVPVYVC